MLTTYSGRDFNYVKRYEFFDYFTFSTRSCWKSIFNNNDKTKNAVSTKINKLSLKNVQY